jgi:hypothetical protein
MAITNLDDLIDNIEMWQHANVYQTSPYRKSLFSPVIYGDFHKDTANGVVVTVFQYRKDFYKPKDWDQEKGFFLFDRIVTEKNLNNYVAEVDDSMKKFATNIADLLKSGFVLSNWDIKQVKARCYLSRSNYEFIKQEVSKNGNFVLDGAHIRTLKHSTPQFEGHLPFESSVGSFYYSTELCLGEIKPDYDHRFDLVEDLESDTIEKIEEEDYNIASIPVYVEGF